MKKFTLTILCCLAILSVSIIAVSASSSFLAEIVELADSYKGGSGGGGRGGGGSGGRGGGSSGGGRGGGRGGSSSGGRGGRGSGSASGGGRGGRNSGRNSGRGASAASGKSGRNSGRGASASGKTGRTSGKTSGMAGRMAGRTRAAGLKAAQARASLSKMASAISAKFSKVSPALSKAFSAVAPNMARTVAAMTKAVKAVNTIKGPRVNALTARINAAFAAPPTTAIGKLTAAAIQQSVKNRQVAAAAAAATTVSGYKIDKGLLTKNEAFSTKGYVPADKKGNVVGKSGVTVGTGFDIGQQSVKGLKSLGLSPSLVDKLSPYTGLTKQKAVEALAKNPLSISAAEAKAIDKAVMDKSLASLARDYEKAAAKNPNAVKNFKDLPSAVQSVAYSVQHQYGSIKTATPGFFSQLTKNDYKGMVNNLRDFKDAYSTRRNREADHLEKGLQGAKG